jgi:hypothetical protein
MKPYCEITIPLIDYINKRTGQRGSARGRAGFCALIFYTHGDFTCQSKAAVGRSGIGFAEIIHASHLTPHTSSLNKKVGLPQAVKVRTSPSAVEASGYVRRWKRMRDDKT